MSRDRQFERDGFQIIPEFLSPKSCAVILAELTDILSRSQPGRRPRGGVRNMLSLSSTANTFATSPGVVSLVSERLNGRAFPVRAILFDKNENANWGVPWHQDLAIAVAEKIETPGFNAWSVKDGVVHVNPPMAVLEMMLTIRLHLDDCPADNGALRVLPGSHLCGELSAEAISDWADRHAPVGCAAAKGDALLMRPLLLHASSAAKNPSHRRVLHVEYAVTDLPNGLKWSERK